MTLTPWAPGTLADEVLYPGQMAMPHKGIHALIKHAIKEGDMRQAHELETVESAQQLADDAIFHMLRGK